MLLATGTFIVSDPSDKGSEIPEHGHLIDLVTEVCVDFYPVEKFIGSDATCIRNK